MSKSPKGSGFVAHYEELRGRLIKCILAVGIAACVFYALADQVLGAIIRPVGRVVFTAPGDAFLARITLAFYGGIFLAFPVTLYQAWRFVAIGLKAREIKYVRIFAPCSMLLFLAGVTFAYFVAVPVSIRFLLGFSNDVIVPMITVRNYVSFVGNMLLVFGIVFELPLSLMFLAKIGLVSPELLAQKRKYAVIFILVGGALMTPPDIVTQIMVAVPLIVLYEAGIIAAKWVYAKSP